MKLQIHSAFYGSPNIFAIDVTEAVQKIAAASTIYAYINVDSSTFGIPDPDPGVVKSLSICCGYSDSSSKVHKSGVDGESIQISTSSNPIQLLEATYSSANVYIDITDPFYNYLISTINFSEIPVGDSAFMNSFCNGRDIDPGNKKVLTISYQLYPEMVEHKICICDGQSWNISKFIK